MQISPIAIVGAGPAGIATAIQLKRQGFNPLIFEQERIVGLLCNANLVENYLGFPKGIRGVELVKRMSAHLTNLQVTVTMERVINIDWQSPVFVLQTSGGNYLARVLVLASGTRPVTFTDFIIPQVLRSRVFYEVYPLSGVSGACIAIVGAGDAAYDYALNLSRSNKVLIINRGAQASCLPLLEMRAKDQPNIYVIDHGRVLSVLPGLPEDQPETMTLECDTPQGIILYVADYLLGAIGRKACLDFLSKNLENHQNTLVEQGRLYIIGDVHAGHYRQAAIAAGQGIEAAMRIAGYFKEEQ